MSWMPEKARVLAAAGLLAFAIAPASELPAEKLQGGTHFNLELAHHITSSRTAVGSPIYFRVVDDVKTRDQVLIRKATIVEGRMQAVGDRSMLGGSGALNFGVRHVRTVDDQNVRVLASVSRQGRDRDGAVVGWVIMWGIFGLMTKGVDAYVMRGAQLDAEVLTDRFIVPSAAQADDNGPLVNAIAAIGHRYGTEKNRLVTVNLERAPKTTTLAFTLPESRPVAAATLTSVGGSAVPETIRAVSTTGGAIEFAAWDVVKYCDDGPNRLRFRASLTNHEFLDIDYELPVKLERKVRK